MKFGGIGLPELMIILVVALLLFGPKNLPKLGSALGSGIKNFREGLGSVEETDAGTPSQAPRTSQASHTSQGAAEAAKQQRRYPAAENSSTKRSASGER